MDLKRKSCSVSLIYNNSVPLSSDTHWQGGVYHIYKKVYALCLCIESNNTNPLPWHRMVERFYSSVQYVHIWRGYCPNFKMNITKIILNTFYIIYIFYIFIWWINANIVLNRNFYLLIVHFQIKVMIKKYHSP